MIGKVKDMLGIEGVRLQLATHQDFDLSSGLLTGTLSFSSLRKQRIRKTTLWLEETYRRGRGGQKLISTYELGKLTTTDPIDIAPRESLELPFVLRFAERRSRIDSHGVSVLLKPLVYLAKKSVAAQSVYVLHARADVEGVKLTPQAQLLL